MPPIDLVIPILAFFTVVSVGSAIAIVVAARRRGLRPRLGSTTAAAVPVEPAAPIIVRAASRLGHLFTLGRISDKLGEQLAKAGYYSDTAATAFLGVKFVLLIFGAIATTAGLMFTDLTIPLRIYLIGLGAALSYFIPNLAIQVQRHRRSKVIRNFLPHAVDLLEVCVSAGMGLDMAWNAVSDEVRQFCPTLADEMTLVNLEVQLGAARTDAMRNMAARTGAEELSALVALLIQSERFGTSIAEALRVFASSSREQRSTRAEIEAEKMAVKLLFPLVFCIFPVMLIVVLGPAVLTLYRVLGPGS